MNLRIRGLHIDPARRNIRCDTVIDILEQIKNYNINTLHIHLTDDQGIAFSSKILNYSGGWTKDEMIRIATCAKEHNIQIIPEIDIPGHSYALRSLLDSGKYDYRDQMGIITKDLIKLEHLDKILEIFEELSEIFNPEYIHIGGDETRGGSKDYFQEIVNKFCGKFKKILAWEDILAKIEIIPDNLYIHRWKHRVYPQIAKNLEKIPNSRIIYSNNYYLDTCIDPITAYRSKIPEDALGCIACCWGELISEDNIYKTIFPSIGLLGRRWTHFEIENPLFLLKDMISDNDHEWRRKQWSGFILKEGRTIPLRSSTSVKKSTVLDREHDHYPLISSFLINFGVDLYNYIYKNTIPLDKDLYNEKLSESGISMKTIHNLWDTNLTIDKKKTIIRRLRKETLPEEQSLFKNGFRMIFREVLRY